MGRPIVHSFSSTVDVPRSLVSGIVGRHLVSLFGAGWDVLQNEWDVPSLPHLAVQWDIPCVTH
jgi:hypothetical protein